MEIEGHPTQDVVEELEHRGAIRVEGDIQGPRPDTLRFLAEQLDSGEGFWLFLPHTSFMTGFDESPV